MTVRIVAACALCASSLAVLSCAKAPPPVLAPRPVETIGPVRQLQADIDALLDRPGHLHGIWGVVVHSLRREQRLYERNPGTLLVPASGMKLVSLAAAAEAVGWNFTFDTTLLAAGSIANGVLLGDLIVKGSGDPSVLGRGGDDSLSPWIDALRARGITRVDGRVIADDDAQEEPRPGYAWAWDDLGYTYGALPGALNLAENRLYVTVSPATAEGLPAILELPSEARDLALASDVRTAAPGSGVSISPEFVPGRPGLTLSGTIGVGEKPAVVSVAAGNPTEWMARGLRNRLLAAGIDVTGGPLDADDLAVKPDWSRATLLYTHRSPPLAEIARPLLKDSINLYSEVLLRLATGHDGARTAAAGLDAVRERLASWGIPREGIQIVDGSGLSRRNVVAAETLAAILRRFYDESGAAPYMQAQAIAGRDGTLASRMKGTPAEGNAVGKTGSMSNVRTLAGFVRTADGEPLVFAIIANNFEGPASGVTATIDQVVVRLATFSRNAASAAPATSAGSASKPPA